ncbi:microsomal triacylglycerol transfer protein isoform X2 [Helicoverpa zea]|uniref:microsomal triacylglycerol transfer protein isoform X2 n=1 Tax=Helicoverpa zea TaxID=7113 RepID=UPI001F57F88E|nr:microsomal triacylglycerol transfer protein isoform X2 [Helicoverpa zea]
MSARAAACALLALWLCARGGAERALLAPAAYELESALELNDAARADREVGYRLRATLHVDTPWAQPPHYLLRLRLESPKLYLRGKHVNADFMPYDSVWDEYSDSTFYAHWTNGLIQTAYLDTSDLPDVLNYKKALLSLFQIQQLEGEHNETDLSGPCMVQYETISPQVFRKIKMRCSCDAGGVSARRVLRYSLEQGRLRELYADELLALPPAGLGVKARSWHRLAAPRAAPGPRSAGPQPPDLAAALAALPASLAPQPLALSSPPADDDVEELGAALREESSSLASSEPGAGGTAPAARALLRLLPAARAANSSALLHLLRRDDALPLLPELCRVLGLAGTRAAHSAVADFLQLHSRDPLAALADTYLAAFALAPRPDDWAVQEVLRLGDEARADTVRASALLAGAAAARAGPRAAAARDQLARGLARCRDAACRALRLLALGNLRRADCADLLLEHAERADAASLAAVTALARLPPAALTFSRLDRLSALALRAGAALELRAAALELVVDRRAAVPTPLASVAAALQAERGADAHELRRVLWGRAEALAAAPGREELRALRGRLAPALRGWDARAAGGTSAVLARAPGWGGAGWRAELRSAQVARAGLLRRGTVRLLFTDDDDADEMFDALTVEVWTKGLEAFSGASSEDADSGAGSEDGGEEAEGGLALSVGGARMRDLQLFRGQAELLGHVWAGTASAPTPALRALLPLHEHAAALPLAAGAWARAHTGAGAALALDAAATVSLWWRSARAELAVRAAGAGAARLAVRVRWAALEARAALGAAPRLRLGADLDFYSGVALCVRASSAPHALEREVTLSLQAGARRLRVTRRRRESTARAGRTLSLGRRNDATCRTLREPDDAAEQ